MPLIAGDHRGAGLLVGPHHLPPIFGVELAGEGGGVDEITEQHRELAAFGLGDAGVGWCRGGMWRLIVL
jgi:hypothetical protein